MLHTERRSAAFTLLEILAVVLMFALLTLFVAPNLGAMRDKALRSQADAISAKLELARQRAIATGTLHRLNFDLVEHSYRLEWLGDPSEAEGPDSAQDQSAFDARVPLSLEPPRKGKRKFVAIPHRKLGRPAYLPDHLVFGGVETAGGFTDRGEVGVTFEADGSAEFTRIHLDDEAGRTLVIEVLPLADTVRIVDDDSF